MNAITGKYWLPVKTVSSDFEVELKLPPNSYKYCIVTSASIPKTYYSLPTDATVTIVSDLWTEVITFPKANYNPITLGIYLRTQLAALSRVVTVHYPDASIEPDTNKFTLTFTGVANVSLSCSSIYLAHMFGIPDANIIVASSSNVWISPNVLDYQSHNKIVIKSNIVTNPKQNFQEIISNGVPYNSAISYICPSLAAHFRILNPLSDGKYRFEILDEIGNTIDFNGAEVHFTICLFSSSELDQYIKQDIETRARIILDTMQNEPFTQNPEPEEGETGKNK